MKLQGDFANDGISVRCKSDNTYDMTNLEGKICVPSKGTTQ